MSLALVKALWLLQSPVVGQLCSYVNANQTWSGGARLELNLVIDTAVSSWTVGFQYGVDVSLEAWKGDIIKHNSQSYSLTNKCYNGIVYPCQCLEIGFLIRYSTELLEHPNATFTFNGSPAPTCSSQPDCSTGTVPGAPTSGGGLLNLNDEALPTVTTTTTTKSTTTTTEDLGCNSKSTLCPGYDQVCQIPSYDNCAYCAGFDCMKGCDTNSNCPADRPLCGAGGDSHTCGCNVDSDCSGGQICENSVCIEGCRTDSACTGWDSLCTPVDSPKSPYVCNYCEGILCEPGCVSNQNCDGHDAVCNSPENTNCYFCTGHNCTAGCISDTNCPALYPVCGGGGPNLCGCSATTDCTGHDALCNIPSHDNCFWCAGPECRMGCSSNANCPADRPVCGAGAGMGSGESHTCGCNMDSDCSGGKICEDAVCIEGCRTDSACTGWDSLCTPMDSPSSPYVCNYCEGILCEPGCVSNQNCDGHDAVCNSPENTNCYFCTGHNCTAGCISDTNCPSLYPVCGGGGPNLCGCSANTECTGYDALCNIPSYDNCFWCAGPECRMGCASDANCPADRPVCGAGASLGSGDLGGDSHTCGCNTDSDCSGLNICENAVCIEGCRTDGVCPGFDNICSNTSSPVDDCAYCEGILCTIGCTASSNCVDYDALCTVPDHDSCYFCGNNSCEMGCTSSSNCPENYPICGGAGPNRCGCSDVSQCKVGYACDPSNFKCTAPSGVVLLDSIKIYTDDCVGCTTEGTVVRLLGERNFNFQTGVPCMTNQLDIVGSAEYTTGSSYEFLDVDELGACFGGALNSRLTDGGSITWTGSGVWTPQLSQGICVDWQSDSAFAWYCNLDGPASGGSGTVWTLSSCDIFFSTTCP